MGYFNEVNVKQNFPEMEKKILEFWKKNKCFEKSIENRKNSEEFIYYDGPPFATGLPHYGHLLGGTIKDVIPRYQTMRGKKVKRRFGWDCHGVPVEHEVEKLLNLKNQQDIEKLGIKKFCESCRDIVLKYTNEWKKIVYKTGRWVDIENPYRTMDADYMESIIGVFKLLWDKGLIYEGKKVISYSPKLASSLSNFEAGLNYKDIDDPAITVKFELINQKNTFILSWTTTPWTLPSNLGLCVNEKIKYIKIKSGNQYFILSKKIFEKISKNFEKSILSELFKKDKNFTITEEFYGKDLIDEKYKPIFPFFKDHKNSFGVFTDSFVSEENGTGIVHLAPTGEDDARILSKNNIELLYPFNDECFFDFNKDETIRKKVETLNIENKTLLKELDGKYFRLDKTVKESIESNANDFVLKYLKEKDILIKREQIRHSYPHCWRTDCALMYRGMNTLFVNIQSIKNKLIEKNQNINWIPSHVKNGRFGKILENAPDWSISRSRYWGSPIPLWKCNNCKNKETTGSLKEIHQKSIKKGNIITIRHGEAEHNINNFISSDKNAEIKLTQNGVNQCNNVTDQIIKSNLKIDIIFSSPFLRTKQTAEIIAKKINYTNEIIIDNRLSERNFGSMNKKSLEEWNILFTDASSKFYNNPHNGETGKQIYERIQDFLKHLKTNFKEKNILIVTHGAVLPSFDMYFYNIKPVIKIPKNCELNTYSFSSRPSNDNDEIDFHRPYIDEIKLKCNKCGSEMIRSKDVLDCWFESGAMPYASNNLKIEDLKTQPKKLPADFIAEGLDQTRGWFYTLHVIANSLFETESTKNIIVNGTVLAEDGNKMSKSKKNYPDINLVLNKYGADAIRIYLMSSPAVRAENLKFSQSGVEETLKKIILPIWNSYYFFVTYANIDNWKFNKNRVSNNKIDQWILSELKILSENFKNKMDNFDIEFAQRGVFEFLDKLTNFYIRRSRKRFWKSEIDDDKNNAFQTLYIVIKNLTKIIAPVAPFFSEEIWQNIRKVENLEDSVHLSTISALEEIRIDDNLVKEFSTIKSIISLVLSIRSKKKIKVRQPLSNVKILLPLNIEFDKNQIPQILEELNIKSMDIVDDFSVLAKKIAKPNAKILGPKFGKDVQFIIKEAKNGNFKEENNEIIVGNKWHLKPEEVEIIFEGLKGLDVESNNGLVVALNTEITDKLYYEGIARDIIRHIQDMRKDADYIITDKINISINCNFINHIFLFFDLIKKETLAKDIKSTELNVFQIEKEIKIDDLNIKIRIEKSHP